jgi:hypothetical protein
VAVLSWWLETKFISEPIQENFGWPFPDTDRAISLDIAVASDGT